VTGERAAATIDTVHAVVVVVGVVFGMEETKVHEIRFGGKIKKVGGIWGTSFGRLFYSYQGTFEVFI
jgi:hypothetical protein